LPDLRDEPLLHHPREAVERFEGGLRLALGRPRDHLAKPLPSRKARRGSRRCTSRRASNASPDSCWKSLRLMVVDTAPDYLNRHTRGKLIGRVKLKFRRSRSQSRLLLG
jgi:hypothetical protein